MIDLSMNFERMKDEIGFNRNYLVNESIVPNKNTDNFENFVDGESYFFLNEEYWNKLFLKSEISKGEVDFIF